MAQDEAVWCRGEVWKSVCRAVQWSGDCIGGKSVGGVWDREEAGVTLVVNVVLPVCVGNGGEIGRSYYGSEDR